MQNLDHSELMIKKKLKVYSTNSSGATKAMIAFTESSIFVVYKSLNNVFSYCVNSVSPFHFLFTSQVLVLELVVENSMCIEVSEEENMLDRQLFKVLLKL